jgi:hypothetical protein
VIDGANKDWKEYKIKKIYFANTTYPTVSQIKTKLKKIPFMSGGVANSGLVNNPNFAQQQPKGIFNFYRFLSI